ncbi:hypothetical protein OKA05_05295 [Luteolibacter arcticus]|uniref:DUF3592 domain-containing protein n=1 Tax=Luteolibacter arcticus TaxID=1581411 RepID=A0ABT3GEB7_9BACT|nr:hypothetical protein [Luteolibacter arcticus]MCW1921957.1 hypothetical protein [Luteolibacter arcticus]
MIRPWYRSRLFWLGVPGFFFFLWAWGKANTTKVVTYLGPGCGWAASGYGKFLWFAVETTGDELVALDLREGEASEVSDELEYYNSSFPSFAVPRFHTSVSSHPSPAPPWFPPPRWQAERLDNGSSYWFLSLPYWLLIAGYTGIWLVGLGGWQRRKAHLVEPSATPPP